MSNIGDFKDFVRKNPILIDYVKEGKNTWQEFYELYDLYKEDTNIWDKYLKKEINDNKNISINNILDYAKNIDVDKLQDGISSIQKAIDLFSGMLTKNNKPIEDNSYRPRPVYRRFDD